MQALWEPLCCLKILIDGCDVMIDARLFEAVFSPDKIRLDEPMSAHTTFRTGGSADIMLLPSETEEIARATEICGENGIPYCIIGNGSNLLVADKGIRGAVIKLGRGFSKVSVSGCTVAAQAGALLSSAANAALRHSLKGMEFASGIPGSVGGAVCMNAGAYGGEMKDVVKEVKVFCGGRVKSLSNAEAGFVYRSSRIMQEGMIVLEMSAELEEGSYDEIKALMDDLNERRRTKQPVDKPSAGSTFKRPEGNFAGRLIEEAGLRGFSVGGAQVSEKHCGFVINKGGATSSDIIELIDIIKKRVFESSGIMLEEEVRKIGEF